MDFQHRLRRTVLLPIRRLNRPEYFNEKKNIHKSLPLTQATENEPRSEQMTIYTRTLVCPYLGATLIMRPSEIERAIAV